MFKSVGRHGRAGASLHGPVLRLGLVGQYMSRSGGPALQEQVHLAQYSHLPVGSMHGDWALQTLDALFGRRLRDGGHLLWLADPALPDIAGSADPTAVDDRFFAEEAGTEVRGVGVLSVAGAYHLGGVLRKP